MILNLKKYSILILIFLFSCDFDRNNPIVYDSQEFSTILSNSAVRDFVIIKNFSADDFHFNAFNHSNRI